MTDLKEAARKAISCLDLTNLNDDCTDEDIIALCAKAQTPFGPVAAVCIWPQFVEVAATALRGTSINIATVVNFPSGGEDIQSVRSMTAQAVEHGANEIDMVIPWARMLEGQDALIAPTVASVVEAAGSARVKAIIETGMLETEERIKRASTLAIEGGADFIKTSTGKVAVNATPQSARWMLEVLANRQCDVGFKPAGGVKTTQDAADYLEMAAEIMGEEWLRPNRFRFGASSVLDALIATLKDEEKPKESSGY